MTLSRALVTFGTGTHADLLSVALPSFQAYAARHGYELLIADMPASDRPPSWLKVAALSSALERFSEVLWLDADVVVVDDSEDIAVAVPASCWQGLAMHAGTSDGEHPNHGVWLVRRSMRATLRMIWSMTQYLHHPWWEQAASLELLGYDPSSRPVRITGPSALRDRTAFLGSEWNCLPSANVAHPRFMHAAGQPNRIDLMKRWADGTVRGRDQ